MRNWKAVVKPLSTDCCCDLNQAVPATWKLPSVVKRSACFPLSLAVVVEPFNARLLTSLKLLNEMCANDGIARTQSAMATKTIETLSREAWEIIEPSAKKNLEKCRLAQ